jgi:hypothetical protein
MKVVCPFFCRSVPFSVFLINKVHYGWENGTGYFSVLPLYLFVV